MHACVCVFVCTPVYLMTCCVRNAAGGLQGVAAAPHVSCSHIHSAQRVPACSTRVIIRIARPRRACYNAQRTTHNAYAHSTEGLITPRTRWREYSKAAEAEIAFKEVSQNKTGSKAKELFEVSLGALAMFMKGCRT